MLNLTLKYIFVLVDRKTYFLHSRSKVPLFATPCILYIFDNPTHFAKILPNEKKKFPIYFSAIWGFLKDNIVNEGVFSPRKKFFCHITVASKRTTNGICRRNQIAEEVPGLYIRRITLEKPKSAAARAAERPASGLQSPTRHVCQPRKSYVPSTRPNSR